MSKKKVEIVEVYKDGEKIDEIEQEVVDGDNVAENVEEVAENTVNVDELDWKATAKKLKELVDDQSIDTYFRRDKINNLRERYNNKERSEELFNDIWGCR